MSASVEGLSEYAIEFVPLTVMPTDRLQDIMNDLVSKQMSVVNLDALIPNTTSSSSRLLKTILLNLTPSVRTLSLRFNNFKSLELCEVLLEWLLRNNTLENLYLMGTNMDEKFRLKIEDAWGKRLVGHRTETYGFSFFRINPEIAYIPPDGDVN